MRTALTFSHCRALLLCKGEPGGTAVYMTGDEETAAAVLASIPAGTALISLEGTDWNRDFSPWPAQAVFRGGDFSGGASAFLQCLCGEVIPAAETLIGKVRRRMLVGYSLSGLFAVWAAMQTNVFMDAASVSGSLWFDGFTDYAAAHAAACRAQRVYFSVGDRERFTRNPRMQRVEEAMRQTCALLQAAGVTCTCELNPGNHFVHVPERIARGINWLLAQ